LLAVSVAGKDGQAVLAAQTGTRSFAFTTARFEGQTWKGKPLAAELPAAEGAISALLVHSNGERIRWGPRRAACWNYRLKEGSWS